MNVFIASSTPITASLLRTVELAPNLLPRLQLPQQLLRNAPLFRQSRFPSKRPPERPESNLEAAAPARVADISTHAPEPPSTPHVYTIQRKAERVSMAGTNAYATLGEQGTRRARVLDLGFGGVAIELDVQEELPDNILAVLHVPILPPVRVNLKPVWSQRTTQGVRVGCSFVS